MKTLFLSLLAVAVVAGCAFRQELHPFPEEAAVMIQNEGCDCEVMEFVGEEAVTVLTSGLTARERTEGRVSVKGAAPKPYSFTKGPLYVDADPGLLNRSGSVGVERDLVSGKTSASSRAFFKFKGVKQAAELLNPFDGETYRLSAEYDGGPVRVVVEPNSGEGAVGELASAYSGTINGRAYRLRIVRQWEGTTVEESADREFVWHHYPDGAYIVISNDEGVEVKVFEGANPRQSLGLEAFNGYRSIAFVPRGTPDDLKRDFFLFYYASAFSRELAEAIRLLPRCMDSPEEPGDEEECPPNMVIE